METRCVCLCVYAYACGDQSGCKAGGWLLGYAWKTSGMCWCLHFSLLTGSICCSTIETVLDRLGVRDSGSFLHIWQRLALLPGESHPPGEWLCSGPWSLSAWASGSVWICLLVTSISTCFSNFITPNHHLCGPRPLTDPCCAPITPTSALQVTWLSKTDDRNWQHPWRYVRTGLQESGQIFMNFHFF